MDLSNLSSQIFSSNALVSKLPGAPVCTPTTYSEYLSSLVKGEVYLKHEQLQSTGSFKYRGAFTKINMLTDDQKVAGVVAASTGNHGMAVAKAAGLSNVCATIFVPEHTSMLKQEKISRLGADIQKVSGDCLVAENHAREYARQRNKIFISPYNDLTVLTGQGGIGVELIAQLESFDSVLISVGGGGLIGGIGAFLKGEESTKLTEIIGCWPENSPVLYECLKAGKVIDVPEIETLSDATAGNLEKETITFDVCQTVIDKKLLVSEAQIASAMRLALEQEGVMIEGAAGVALAALIKHKELFIGKRVVILLCGRNISQNTYMDVVQ